MDVSLRHEQFLGFRDLARGIGHHRVREADLRTRATLTTNGAQEAAADVEWLQQFFADTATDPLAERTRQPLIGANGQMPQEFCGCFPEVTMEIRQLATTLTDTELSELCDKLSECMLTLTTGQDTFFEKRVGYFMSGSAATKPGPSQGTASATSPFDVGTITGQRGIVEPMKVGMAMSDPLLLLPLASLTAQLHGEGAWTTTDAIVITLTFHGWLAAQGEQGMTGKVMLLSDAVNLANGANGAALFRARAGK